MQNAFEMRQMKWLEKPPVGRYRYVAGGKYESNCLEAGEWEARA